MTNIAIFASGNGSNFEALVNGFKNDKENEVALLLCNKKVAFVLNRAKRLDILYEIIEYKKGKRSESENLILNKLREYNIDIIFLAGFMKILSADFINNSEIPIINIHPSLLPKYKGVSAIEQAFKSNDKEIGITIHRVSEEVDSGEIILQKSIPLRKDKGLDIVEEDVHKLEHEWYPKIAKDICDEYNWER